MVQKVLSMIFFHFKKCFWFSVGKSSYLFFEVRFRSLKSSNFSPETAGLAKVLAWNPNTQWKRYFITHSDCWVKMEDEVYKPEIVRNIWTLIGYMIENFRNITTVTVTILKKCYCRSTIARPVDNYCLKKRLPQTQNKTQTLHFHFKKHLFLFVFNLLIECSVSYMRHPTEITQMRTKPLQKNRYSPCSSLWFKGATFILFYVFFSVKIHVYNLKKS